MNLRQVVETYRKLAGEFGRPVALAAFGLSREETEKTFGVLEEDYHIGRHFQFQDLRAEGAGEAFSINGFPQTHVSMDSGISEAL